MNEPERVEEAAKLLRLPRADPDRSVWDTMTAGLPAEDKARAERILLQAGYRLNDPLSTVAGFLGWIESLSRRFPEQMQASTGECAASVARSAALFRSAVERLEAWEKEMPARMRALSDEMLDKARPAFEARLIDERSRLLSGTSKRAGRRLTWFALCVAAGFVLGMASALLRPFFG